MPSGKPLTEQQVDAILSLVGEQAADGRWQWSYCDIARQLKLHRHTIEQTVRRSAVRWSKHTAWKKNQKFP